MEGLIRFKSSINEEIASVYFLRVSSCLCFSGSINATEIITSFSLSSSKKAYSNRLDNSFKVNPSILFMFLLISVHYCIFLYYFHQF